jgi:archaellum component FlaF (FlaF/FlaG flagellin family)
LKNKKGTAEVIGSVMFIVILLFFFTNVYLWHDAATKEMNDLYVQKMNTPIVVTVSYDANNHNYAINVTNKGGVDATLSMLWINEKSTSNGPDVNHLSYPLNNVVEAGGSKNIPSPYNPPAEKTVIFKVITTTGNPASYTLEP